MDAVGAKRLDEPVGFRDWQRHAGQRRAQRLGEARRGRQRCGHGVVCPSEGCLAEPGRDDNQAARPAHHGSEPFVAPSLNEEYVVVLTT